MDKKNARKARQRKLRNRRIALTLCLMLTVAVASIGGTIAWLTASTTEVKNTFTPSTINIELKEHEYDSEENELGTGEVTSNTDYEMVPGLVLPKDPFVRVVKNSESCYVFVEIVKSNNLNDFIGYNVNTPNWTQLAGVTGSHGGDVYYYKDVVPASMTDTKLDNILKDNQVTVNASVTKADMDNLTDDTQPTLTFYAYAVQYANLGTTDMTEIWNLAKTAA